ADLRDLERWSALLLWRLVGSCRADTCRTGGCRLLPPRKEPHGKHHQAADQRDLQQHPEEADRAAEAGAHQHAEQAPEKETTEQTAGETTEQAAVLRRVL